MATLIKRGPSKIDGKVTYHNEDNPNKNAEFGFPTTGFRYAQSRVSCELKDGILMARGGTSSYYIFNQNGQRLLILNRKQNQSIVISQNIDIEVLEINNNEVKLGINCPDDTVIRCEDSSCL